MSSILSRRTRIVKVERYFGEDVIIIQSEDEIVDGDIVVASTPRRDTYARERKDDLLRDFPVAAVDVAALGW